MTPPPIGEKPIGEKPIGEKPIGEKPIGEKPIGEKPGLDADDVPGAGDAPSFPEVDVHQGVEPDVRAGQGAAVE
ncbi:MAG: hypothetical protein FJ276_17405 [Planctomycetes bacterium]|nr:hypothetical protein [Planctomycetota bacterium]